MRLRRFFSGSEGSVVALALSLLSMVSFGTDSIGLVLSGGGARGAYEIGVWRAICELGIDKRIVVISGTSVGALNGALFGSVKDPARCEGLWTKSIGNAFCANSTTIHNALQETLDNFDKNLQIEMSSKTGDRKVTKDDLKSAMKATVLSAFSTAAKAAAKAAVGPGVSPSVCDSRKLREVLTAGIPPGRFPGRPCVYATAWNKETLRKKSFRLNELEREQVVDRLLASAAIPLAFEAVVIDGEAYVDGGFGLTGGDNVPIAPIVDNHPEVKTAIVVYLRSKERLTERLDRKSFPGVQLIEIIPSKDIGGLVSGFDDSKGTTCRLIELGYRDARAVLGR